MNDTRPSCRNCGASLPPGETACPACATVVLGETGGHGGSRAPASTAPGATETTGRSRTAAPFDGFPPGTVVDDKYEVLEKLGIGGFGEVYRIHHRILKRDLALKTLHPALVVQPQLRERFFREARVLMDLSHPQIVTMREVGEWNGYLFLIMDFCPGKTLAQVRTERGRLPAEEACRLLLPVLEGLHYAHERGVVHRDLKPANLILAPSGAVRILDFGIAKVLDEKPSGPEGGLTDTGVAIGTVHYMSPEQAGGGKIDGRADLYAIGVILYELVAGQRPFEGESMTHVVKQILLDKPAALKRLGVSGTPRGFEELLQRALAKEPQQRPASAREMARELEAVLAGEAAPPGARPRLLHASRIAAALCGGVLLAWGASTLFPRGPRPGTGNAPANQPLELLPDNEPGEIDPAPEAPVAGPAAARVDFAKDVLRHVERVNGVAFHPEGRLLATACGDRLVRLWDVAAGEERLAIDGHHAEVTRVEFSPDGRWLASTGEDSQVRVWSVPDGKPLFVLEDMKTPGEALAFSPSQKLLAASSRDGQIRIWDLETRALRHTCIGHRRPAITLTFAGDSAVLASGGFEPHVRLWNARTGKSMFVLLAHQRPITGLAFLPDRKLLTASMDGFVKVWPFPHKSSERSWLAFAGGVSAMATSPDRAWLATTGRDDTLRLWSMADPKDTRAFPGQDPDVHQIAWSPDGRTVALASAGGTVRLVRVAKD